jgi:phage shock protein PspC (stress-responsive transcriptional regulator)
MAGMNPSRREVNLMDKRLTRSKNRMLAGVLAGIAERLKVDPTLVRVIYVVGMFTPLIKVLLPAYLILWLVMPEAETEITIEPVLD